MTGTLPGLTKPRVGPCENQAPELDIAIRCDARVRASGIGKVFKTITYCLLDMVAAELRFNTSYGSYSSRAVKLGIMLSRRLGDPSYSASLQPWSSYNYGNLRTACQFKFSSASMPPSHHIMAQVPTPPPSRPGSEAPDLVPKPGEASSDLLQSLDTLLEQYLRLLDRQQKLQSGLAKQLSSVWSFYSPGFRPNRAGC